MTRDNIVFATCGLLLGLIIGSLVIGPRIAQSQLAGSSLPSETAVMPAGSAMAGSDTTGGATSTGMGSDVGSGMASAVPPGVPAASGGPAAASGLNPMGMVLRQLAALKAEVAKDPKNAGALVQLGNLYMDATKFAQAAEYYERAIAVRDDASVRTDLGICYRKVGQQEKALAMFRGARKLDASQWQASFNEAIVLADLHRVDEARAVASTLAQSRPGDAEVARLQAMLAARQ